MSYLNYSENMFSYFYDNYLYSDQSMKFLRYVFKFENVTNHHLTQISLQKT